MIYLLIEQQTGAIKDSENYLAMDGVEWGKRVLGQDKPQEEEHPHQVQQVAQVSNHPPEVAVCEPPGSAVSSGVCNVRNTILLNLEVDPGSKEINSLMGIAVCYDTGQITNYQRIMSKRFFLLISWGI